MAKKYTPAAWVGMVLMIFAGLTVSDIGVRIANSHGTEATYRLLELGDYGNLVYALGLLNAAGLMGALVIILSSKQENNLWYAAIAVAGGAGLVGVAYMMITMEQLVENVAGLEGLMNLLSIEFTVTDSTWYYVAVSALVLCCGLTPFLEPYIRKQLKQN